MKITKPSYLNDKNMTQPEYEDKLLNAFIKSYTNFITPFIGLLSRSMFFA